MGDRLGLLLSCFFLSGFAALLYQTAWTRELSFVFGTSELAVAAVLAAYMGGLALGAAVAARYAWRLRRPVLVYGVLELAIALSAVSVPVGIRLINALYVGLLGGGDELPHDRATLTTLFQVGAAFAVLLPPTAFMGATLPLLARHAVRRDADIGSRVGLLYAVNTAGAIGGTLCAAFWLMPEFGLRRTVWVGAALNGVVFALAALLARGTASLPAPVEPRKAPETVATAGSWILPAIALSGAVSFAYEVLWTRLLGQLLGASIQAFATMLGSFLLGISLGSAVAARLATTRARAALGFGMAQLGIALASYTALALADRLADLSQRFGAGPDAALANAAVAAIPLLPITLCLGATFPFAVRLLAQQPEQAAVATARVYAWNTLGAIAGALGAGFLLLPRLGFAGTLGVGVAANLALAVVTAFAARPRRMRLAAAAATAGVVLLALPPQTPWALLSFAAMTGRQQSGEIVYAAVGRSSTVMLFEKRTGYRLTSNGLPEAMIDRKGMVTHGSIARWLCLLPSLLRPEARDLLVIGFGGGMALEAVPGLIDTIDVVELEHEVVTANEQVGPRRAIDPMVDPRLRIHIGDARGALQLTEKRYDAIVSQPSHPWTAGASHLYTQEFFSLVRSRMKSDGVFVQWIGLSFVDEALLRSLMATLVDVFAHVEVYHPRPGGLLFAASDAPLGLAHAGQVLSAAREDYARFGIHRVEDLAAARILDEAGVRALAEGAPLTTDDHNLLASRAFRLGDAALDGASVHALLKDHDALRAGADGLDRWALVRGLVNRGFSRRAHALVLGSGGADEELGRGWIALGLKRPRRAARHFARALELDPASADARVGLVVSRPAAYRSVVASRPFAEVELEPDLATVISAWRHRGANEWAAIAALDADLARIEPGDALFEEAGRLRIQQRLITGGPQASAEALAISETLLLRRWRADKALLRATAAIAADRPDAARGSLERIAERAAAPDWKPLLKRALELSRELPEETAGDLPDRLARGLGAAAEPD
jgi:spermidine synthase